ncbi:helix-turn-helix domain-containing protein [Herbiconiux daphne]|uniref:Helix-turn-helix domain-containing protein n=1 Tax=Herbiconiux daphne TaxID=2970914 RepID=A0ABT2HAI7_9MICO|nr:helix-turn-helix transcriptional regulator [Herbiconiux daphne]MCS5736949.1 helix-turn-helix domain-containing protein [Herbiconiux daphne]
MEQVNIFSLGRRLQAFRVDALDMTQKDFVEMFDVNDKTLSAFENGRANSIHHIAMYVRACNNDAKLLAELSEILISKLQHEDTF